MYLILNMLFIMLIKIKTTSLLSFKLRYPGKYKYTRHGVEGIYQTRCIEPTHSISAGVVSDDEKNAFPSINHLAILIGCLLTTPGLSRHLVSIYEASQKPCSKYKIEISSIDGIIRFCTRQLNKETELFRVQYFHRGYIVLGNWVFNALCDGCYRTTKLCFL